MLLVSAKVGPFKSINAPQLVAIESDVTVFVGMNEAGKTVFLQALEKTNDALGNAEFDPVDDYPRKDLPSYLKLHKTNPSEVVVLTYRPSNKEIDDVNADLHVKLKAGYEFSVTHSYNNSKSISLIVDEKPVLEAIISQTTLSQTTSAAVKKAKSLRLIPEAIKDLSLTQEEKTFLTSIQTRIAASKWESVVQWEVWKWFEQRIPKFLYFSEYDLLPSKMNLADLAQRVEQAKSDKRLLETKHRSVLALLRMADVAVADFTKPGGYEQLKAKIEGVSISLTDQIMEFWKQNENLEVEVDIKSDPDDVAPYNNGANLYLRIRNRRHRGVSTPFRQRSRGFIWFFSFLVWFDSVQQQIDSSSTQKSGLILLLDEPGLALHALAQADFLRYIKNLSSRHQVLYTTHSPFMVYPDKFDNVRVVEDKEKIGTVISSNVNDSDSRTIFPLQAALGWTIAQNLFISKNNLLVEGPSDLIYLKSVSGMLNSENRIGLREDITIVPVGGLDKVVTFIALLGANGLKIVVIHDFRGVPEQKLNDLIKQKIIPQKSVLNASQFRDLSKIGENGLPSDIEDLFTPSLYLDYFNKTFKKELKNDIKENDLPTGDRIIERISKHIDKSGIQIRPSGGFNHYLVASYFASNPPSNLDLDTLNRFESLFKIVNSQIK